MKLQEDELVRNTARKKHFQRRQGIFYDYWDICTKQSAETSEKGTLLASKNLRRVLQLLDPKMPQNLRNRRALIETTGNGQNSALIKVRLDLNLNSENGY